MYLCSVNNGADQLCATAHLIFTYVFVRAMNRFSNDTANLMLMQGMELDC